MKLVITGINGFIGRNLYSFFKTSPEYEIIGVEQPGNFFPPLINLYSWDELNKITEHDCIVHLAGIAHDTNKKKLEEEYYKINTELTKTIYNFFLISTAKTFIFFSSVKAAADFSQTHLIESVIPEPTSVYGKSKLLAEKYILANLPKDGRKVYILRPCMIHGPKPKGNLVSLCNYFDKGLPYPFGNLSNNRSYLSINNLTFILEKLLKSNIDSGIYHLADDEALSTKQIIKLIGAALEKKPIITNLPNWIINAVVWFGTVLTLPINKETIKKLTGDYLVSNEKIKKALNIELPVRAEEGMLYTLKNIK